MKLVEALDILKGMKSRKGELFTCFLATGLNPLHLNTFLAAELSLLFLDQRIEIQSGLYGDFLGNLKRLAEAKADSGIVLMEWIDPTPDWEFELPRRGRHPCTPYPLDREGPCPGNAASNTGSVPTYAGNTVHAHVAAASDLVRARLASEFI